MESPASIAPRARAATTESQAQSEPPMWVAYTLVGTGGALLAGALVTGLISNHDYDELDSGGSDRRCPADFDWRSVRDRGKNMGLAANVLALSGVLVAGTGAVLWYVWGTRDEEAPQASLACLPGACVGQVRLAF